MREFTLGELKQGLICCAVYRNCKGCPCFDEDKMQTCVAGDLSCTAQLMAAAFNCINTMEADIEEANRRIKSLESAPDCNDITG